LNGRVEIGNVSGEPRNGGVTELRVAFDLPPGQPGASPVTVLSQACGACPCAPGSQAAYAASGIIPEAASLDGSELVLTFNPGLTGPATYRLNMTQSVAGFTGGALEVRALLGDVNGDRRTNATDRSHVVAAWTTTGGAFSPTTDLNLDGVVNASDRSLVVAQWTSPVNCAP
jgi:hypothetical protein